MCSHALSYSSGGAVHAARGYLRPGTLAAGERALGSNRPVLPVHPQPLLLQNALPIRNIAAHPSVEIQPPDSGTLHEMSSNHSQSSYSSRRSSLASKDGWHEHVLRKKYRNPMRLKEFLDRLYGQECYQVSIKRDRWLIRVPEPMTKAQLQDLDGDVYQHYESEV